METQRISLGASADTSSAYLIPLNRVGAGTVEIKDFLSVGRDQCNHLVLADPFVSSRHSRIERKSGQLVLRDLHSRNGSFLNGSRVTEAILTLNDRIRFGETTYVFSESPGDVARLSSKNDAWNEQLKRLPAFASTEFPILITGPSGSGKEILTRAVHRHSGRNRGPFVSINCSALSESLIESELFGHIKGSFTGAATDRKGAFESARGGTLFLDEIGDLPLSLQPKLLRALENQEIRPVGADRSIETDVRIIAATHKNLPAQVSALRFREDLFYRLNVCHIGPPALAERMEDFEDLLYAFAKQMRVRFSFGAVQALKEHSWPGNIRELKNLVARVSAYLPGEHIQAEQVKSLIDEVPRIAEPSYFKDTVDVGSAATSGSVIKEIEREMIVRRLVANRGNQRRTAHDLGLPKSTLHDRIKSYSIDLKTIASEAP